MNDLLEKEPMRIHRLQVSNIMRAEAIDLELDPNDHLIIVGGKNRAGKSSTVGSIWFALGGKPDTEMIIREGETEGKIFLDLGDLHVTRRFYPNRNNPDIIESTLEVRPSDPSLTPYRSPQEVLDRLISKVAFDPWDFVEQKPDEQIESIQRGLKLDTTAIDARYREAFEERKAVKKVLASLETKMKGLPEHPDAPEAEVDISILSKKLEEATAENQRINGLKTKAEESAIRLRLADEKIDEKATLVRELAEKLAEEETLLKNWQEQRGGIEKTAIENQKIAAASQPIDITDVTDQMSGAEATNRKVRENQTLFAAREEWNEREAFRASQEQILLDCRTERATMVKQAAKSAGRALEGLEIREEIDDESSKVTYSLWLDGKPFKRQNTATQLQASVALALVENPRLRVFRVADGEKLDPESMNELRKIAEDAKAQIWVEYASTRHAVESGYREVEVTVFIEDGNVVQVEKQPLLAGAAN